MPVCRECAPCWEDRSDTVYRRGECWFCRLKGAFFRRNYRVGEKTRVDPDQPGCAHFTKKE